MSLIQHTRHKCFISYHHADEDEVRRFITDFDHDQDILITRGIGAGMSGDIINSTNEAYIKSRIRELYLRDTSVTIVLIGRNTWSRKFVDWEVAASLRNTPTSNRNGLLAITLPSTSDYADKRLPARLEDNVNREYGYARWWRYPSSPSSLGRMIEEAFQAREALGVLADNSRPLLRRNLSA